MIEDLEDWRRTHFSSEISPKLDGLEVIVCGWVQRTRQLGKLIFIVLRDREGTLQITVHKNKVTSSLFEKLRKLKTEYVIAVKGVVRASKEAPRGVEILPKEAKILNITNLPLPLDPAGKVPADLDTRLDARIVDLRRPKSFAIFKIRHALLQNIREFFVKKGFIEVNTPKIIATATEGGTELFPVSYFDRVAYLAQSPQLYKEELTAAFEKVFEIGPVFRAEEHRTTRHLAELIMVDIEEAFATAEDAMRILEELTIYVFQKLKTECAAELKTLERTLEIPKTPFPRYTYDEILKMLEKDNIAIPWGEDLPTPALRKIGEQLKGPYFITDWPTKSKPFYIKPRNDNPEVCESFDFMWGWLELASGGTRIHNKELLIERLKSQGLNPESFKYHLQTFDWGMPPHAGFGLGLARLLMIICGVNNIRECVLFPRDIDRLTP